VGRPRPFLPAFGRKGGERAEDHREVEERRKSEVEGV
jgi:hypothetical protein